MYVQGRCNSVEDRTSYGGLARVRQTSSLRCLKPTTMTSSTLRKSGTDNEKTLLLEYSSGDKKEARLRSSAMGSLEEHQPAFPPSDIVFQHLIVHKAAQLKEKPNKADGTVLKFGAHTTDHMLQIVWKEELGWMPPKIVPLEPLSLHPCAQVLHYATECFEGMKAYKDKEGRIRLFRPDMHMNRLARSVARLALPSFDKEALLRCIEELLRVERDWISDVEGFSVYIRPTVIATQPSLGVQQSREALLFVVLSPAGSSFFSALSTSRLAPIKLRVDTQNTRAFPGGAGDRKLGSNYAPTIVPLLEAAKLGCSQPLFVMDDKYGGFVGEAGTMNIFFLLRSGQDTLELVTPALDGTILPGVTRDSVLKLATKIQGLEVSERSLRFSEIEAAAGQGRLVEAFGTGTACLIQPVSGLLKESGVMIEVPFDSKAANDAVAAAPGSLELEKEHVNRPGFNLCGLLVRALMDIHYGHTHSEWSRVIIG